MHTICLAVQQRKTKGDLDQVLHAESNHGPGRVAEERAFMLLPVDLTTSP